MLLLAQCTMTLTFAFKFIPILLALALAACGAKANTPAPSASSGLSLMGGATLPDPCSLLTQAEVIAALDAAIKEPFGERELIDAECSYNTQDPALGGSVLIELTAAGPNSASFDQRTHFFATEGARPITELGAPAYAKRGAILTQKADLIVFVIVEQPTQDAPTLFATAQRLTRLVLQRLPG